MATEPSRPPDDREGTAASVAEPGPVADAMPVAEPGPARGGGFEPYQIKLFVFLSVATFFEGYDFLALSQVLFELGKEFGLSKSEQGALVTFINVGTIVAYLLVRFADRWGRRRVLTITIAGYTVLTFLTGLSPNVWAFAVFQFVARIFLIAEWAVSMVYAAEEFPAQRRGTVIGVISAFAALGSVVCAGVTPLLIENTPFGWRSVYFVGILPLVALAYFRRGLKESRRFAQQVKNPHKRRGFTHIWSTPYKKRVIQLGLIWGFTYLATQTAITFWKLFAVEERGFTANDVGAAVAIAAVVAMPLVFYAGKLLDQIGRRKGAVVIYGLTILGVLGCYSLHGRWALTGALVFGIFGASAVLPVMNAYNSELFPTELRGDAFAWANNMIGRVSYVLAPYLVSLVAEQRGWGFAMRLTCVGPVVALVLILVLLPETKDKELEETARV